MADSSTPNSSEPSQPDKPRLKLSLRKPGAPSTPNAGTVAPTPPPPPPPPKPKATPAQSTSDDAGFQRISFRRSSLPEPESAPTPPPPAPAPAPPAAPEPTPAAIPKPEVKPAPALSPAPPKPVAAPPPPRQLKPSAPPAPEPDAAPVAMEPMLEAAPEAAPPPPPPPRPKIQMSKPSPSAQQTPAAEAQPTPDDAPTANSATATPVSPRRVLKIFATLLIAILAIGAYLYQSIDWNRPFDIPILADWLTPATPSNATPVPTPQSPVPTPQSPVPTPKSPVPTPPPTPKSPVPTPPTPPTPQSPVPAQTPTPQSPVPAQTQQPATSAPPLPSAADALVTFSRTVLTTQGAQPEVAAFVESLQINMLRPGGDNPGAFINGAFFAVGAIIQADFQLRLASMAADSSKLVFTTPDGHHYHRFF